MRAISWYDDVNAETPRLIKYISITHDTFSDTVRSAVVDTEQDIVDAVQEVTAVSGNAWELVVRHDPQSGEDAIHYDLQMEDARSVSYSLDGDTVFYIPYPEGCAYGVRASSISCTITTTPISPVPLWSSSRRLTGCGLWRIT